MNKIPIEAITYLITAVITLVPGCFLLAMYIKSLLLIIKVFKRRWKPDLFYGTVSSIGSISASNISQNLSDVNFIADGWREEATDSLRSRGDSESKTLQQSPASSGQENIQMKKLLVGADLMHGGLIRKGARGYWAFDGGRKKSFSKTKFLAFFNGETLWSSKKDIAKFYNLHFTCALMPSFFIFGFLYYFFIMEQGFEETKYFIVNHIILIAPLIMIVPTALSMFLFRLGLKKIYNKTNEDLKKFAKKNKYSLDKGAGREANFAAPPLAFDNNIMNNNSVKTMFYFSGYFTIIFYPIYLIYKFITILSALGAFPRFTIKNYQIVSHMKIYIDQFKRYNYSNVIFKDTHTGKEIEVINAKVADNIANNGLICPNIEGKWLVEQAKSNKENRSNQIIMAAFYDGSNFYYDPKAVLKLYYYKSSAPIWAFLFGLIIGLIFIYNFFACVNFRIEQLAILAICAFIMSYSMILAKKRILNAVEECLKKSFPAYLYTAKL